VDSNGGVGQADQVYIEVSSDVLMGFYNGVISTDEIFDAQGAYRADATVNIYSVVNGGRGQLLQTLTIPTRCESGDSNLPLGTQFGALTLNGFTNTAGSPRLEVSLQVTYLVENNGSSNAVLDSAVATSFFLDEPLEAIIDPQEMPPGVVLEVYEENGIFDVGRRFLTGEVFELSMTTSGTRANGSSRCQASFTYRI